MAAVTRFACALLVALLFACGDKEPPPDPVPTTGWRAIPAFDRLRISLPEEWTRDIQRFGKAQFLFYGPAEDGFKPNVSLHWRPWAKGDSDWFKWQRDKRDIAEGPSQSKVVEEGAARVAGLNGWFLVYDQTGRAPDGSPRACRTIDWLFVKDGHAGFLRGVATADSFDRHRAFFTEVMRRLQIDEPPR